MTAAWEVAYDQIRAKILNGDLKAGVRLKERDLCAELGTSRTPVREAFRQLHADGLVDMAAKRGVTVSGFEEDEAREIFSLGAVLESFGAGLAARKISDEQVEELAEILEASRDALRPDGSVDRAVYSKMDQRFHSKVAEIAGNRRLSVMREQTVSLVVLGQSFIEYNDDDFGRSFEDHRTILDALRARDSEWAEASMRTHILKGKAIVVGRNNGP